MDFDDDIRDLWKHVALSNVQKLEEACEKSLLDPQKRGVFVVENQYGTVLSAELSDRVPYGSIYIMKKQVTVSPLERDDNVYRIRDFG